MANVQSAKKRDRQRLRRRRRNLSHLTAMRSRVKSVVAARDAKDPAAAKAALAEAIQLIAKAAQKGVIKTETASRKISRLTRSVNKIAGATK